MRRRSLLGILALDLLGSACGRPEAGPAGRPDPAATFELPATAAPGLKIDEMTRSLTPTDLIVTPDVPGPLPAERGRAVGAAINRLGVDLFERLGAESGNLVLSPVSVHAALTMVALGAAGPTASELYELLASGHPDPDLVLRDVGHALRRWNEPARPGATLQVSNGLFSDAQTALREVYVDSMARNFGAPVRALDFRGDPGGARDVINGWVALRTGGLIRELLGPGTIRAQTRLVVANAVALEARWVAGQQFDRERTAQAAFTTGAGTVITVPTMVQTSWLRHGELDGARIVELEYEGGGLAMRLILPPPGSASEHPGWLARGLGLGLEPGRLKLHVPRFTLTPETCSLGEALQRLGVVTAFDPAAADFSGIAPIEPPGERLFVSDAVHRAMLAFDEAGTVAAAATAAVLLGAGRPPPQAPPVWRFDRPFLFAVVDRETGAALFMGRVDDPRP